jgi:glutathione S-transferase
MSVLIYGRDTSYNVQKVLWLLEELEIEYSHKQLGGKFGGLETEEFKS